MQDPAPGTPAHHHAGRVRDQQLRLRHAARFPLHQEERTGVRGRRVRRVGRRLVLPARHAARGPGAEPAAVFSRPDHRAPVFQPRRLQAAAAGRAAHLLPVDRPAVRPGDQRGRLQRSGALAPEPGTRLRPVDAQRDAPRRPADADRRRHDDAREAAVAGRHRRRPAAAERPGRAPEPRPDGGGVRACWSATTAWSRPGTRPSRRGSRRCRRPRPAAPPCTSRRPWADEAPARFFEDVAANVGAHVGADAGRAGAPGRDLRARAAAESVRHGAPVQRRRSQGGA